MKRITYIMYLFLLVSLFASCSDDDSTYSQDELEKALIEATDNVTIEVEEPENEKGETMAYSYIFSFKKQFDKDYTGSMRRTFIVYYNGERHIYGNIHKSFIWRIEPSKDKGIVHLTFEEGEKMTLYLYKEKYEWNGKTSEEWAIAFDLNSDPFK